jgi:hypothetical protein
MKLSLKVKIIILVVCAIASVIGFMVKLPVRFRGMDKELHFAFYFVAAMFLNLLFAKRNLFIHAAIFGVLYLFGYCIEHAQAYSNKFYTKRIHGRFDPEDVAQNLKGLLYFTAIYIVMVGLSYAYQLLVTNNKKQ